MITKCCLRGASIPTASIDQSSETMTTILLIIGLLLSQRHCVDSMRRWFPMIDGRSNNDKLTVIVNRLL